MHFRHPQIFILAVTLERVLQVPSHLLFQGVSIGQHQRSHFQWQQLRQLILSLMLTICLMVRQSVSLTFVLLRVSLRHPRQVHTGLSHLLVQRL